MTPGKPTYRFTRFLQTPLGDALEHALWRFPPWKRLTSWIVWREIAQDAEFMASITKGLADHEAGRFYHGIDGPPSETWSPDDPEQPRGWHHDGATWVRDEP